MLSHENTLNDLSSSSQTSETPPFPPTTQIRSTSMQESSLADFLGRPLQEFDHRGLIIEPFSEETERDRSFEEEITAMLLDALIETHAWTTARLKREDIVVAERFEQKVSGIMLTEKDQERARERLIECVNKIKNAISALTETMLL